MSRLVKTVELFQVVGPLNTGSLLFDEEEREEKWVCWEIMHRVQYCYNVKKFWRKTWEAGAYIRMKAFSIQILIFFFWDKGPL